MFWTYFGPVYLTVAGAFGGGTPAQASTSSFLFGAPKPTPAFGAFGNNNTFGASSGGFGQNSTASTSGGIFGQTASSTTPTTFGSNGAFGSKAPTTFSSAARER